MGQHGLECVERVFDRGGIDHHFGVETVYLVKVAEPLRVVGEPKSLRVGVVDGHLVGEKRAGR